jgi:hypothetical protein
MGVPVGGRGSKARRRDQFDIPGQLNAVARPRLTGSRGAERVTAHVRSTLSRAGYDVRDHTFRFNPWPGRLGVTVAGLVYLVAAPWTGALLWTGDGYGALAVLLVMLLLAALAATIGRPLLDRAAWAQRDGLNLLALPRGGRPKYLIVAHRDSKSQPVPLAVRGPAIAAALLSWAALFGLALLSIAHPVAPALALLVAAVATAAAVVLIFCWVGNNSPGALDNASGLVVLLGIAHEQREATDVALLVTDAEELGLAGSRAIARRLPTMIGAINLDGIDDAGPFYLMERFGWPRRRGRAPHLAAALMRAGAELMADVVRRDAPFGIMLDHMPIVDGGMPALTIMRGGLQSLRRVHRPDDDLANLRGHGIAPTVALVGRALDLLRAQEPGARQA